MKPGGLFDAETMDAVEAEGRDKLREKKADDKRAGWYKAKRSQIVSALMKSLRVGDTLRTLYWARVMLAGGESGWYMARRIKCSVAEDVSDPLYAQTALAFAGVYDTTGDQNALWQALYWATLGAAWRTPDAPGIEWHEAQVWWHWGMNLDEIGAGQVTIPEAAVDAHTYWGHKRADRGEPVCAAFSGHEAGHVNMVKMKRAGTLWAEWERLNMPAKEEVR